MLKYNLILHVYIMCFCSLSVGALIGQSMKRNSDLLYSLTHFDLSANPQLGLDPQGTLVFIQEPQTIASLNLSKCGLNFDLVSTRTYTCIGEGVIYTCI